MQLTNQPIQQSNRTIIVDILRGWALLGVVIMNYLDFFTIERDWDKFNPDVFTNILLYVTQLVFSAKAWTMLSLLFGYGFAVLMDNIKEKGHNPYGFFAGRMFWLLVLAFINSALFFGDILKDYALLGLVLLLFYRSSAKTTFITSLVLLIAIPALSAYISSLGGSGWLFLPKLFPLYKSNNLFNVLYFGLKGTWVAQMVSKPYLYTVHVVMLCCMLWGFSLYKINFFNNLPSKLKTIKRAFFTALALSVFFTVFFLIAQRYKIPHYKYYNIYYWSILSAMITIGSAITWLYLAGKLKPFFANLALIGKMTLTNYMVQNLIGLLVFSGFGLKIWSTYPLWFYVLLALVVYTLQVYFSKWWLSKYNYGPIEWIWRQLSYRKKLPLKR